MYVLDMLRLLLLHVAEGTEFSAEPCQGVNSILKTYQVSKYHVTMYTYACHVSMYLHGTYPNHMSMDTYMHV